MSSLITKTLSLYGIDKMLLHFLLHAPASLHCPQLPVLERLLWYGKPANSKRSHLGNLLL